MNKLWRNKTILGIALLIVVSLGCFCWFTFKNSSDDIPLPSVVSTPKTDSAVGAGNYNYTEASEHIGEQAKVTGTIFDVYTSKTGVIFIDFCKNYKSCPFSATIFSSDAKKFNNIEELAKQQVTISGTIKTYNGTAEIVISDPSQIVID